MLNFMDLSNLCTNNVWGLIHFLLYILHCWFICLVLLWGNPLLNIWSYITSNFTVFLFSVLISNARQLVHGHANIFIYLPIISVSNDYVISIYPHKITFWAFFLPCFYIFNPNIFFNRCVSMSGMKIKHQEVCTYMVFKGEGDKGNYSGDLTHSGANYLAVDCEISGSIWTQ